MTENITHRLIFLKALAEGERWITVKSPGAEKGSPVLIRENPDGSASVIGGAGGKLNHLKLRGVKSKEQYKKEAGEKEQSKREAKKQAIAEQRAKDKEAGITGSKARVRKEIKEQTHAEEREYVKTTAKVMGWDEKDLEFDEAKHADLSPAAVIKLAREHHRELVKKANEAYDLNRQSLAMDSEARQQANIGGAAYKPEDPDSISVADLDQTAGPPTGLGFSADYKERAEKAGLTDDELEKEVGQVREKKLTQMTEGERKSAISRGQSAKLVKQELQGVREEDPGKTERLKAHLVEADKALELMKAKKRLDLARKKASEALKSVDKSNVEPKAYVLEVDSADVDSAVENQVTNDLRTIRTRNFLSEAGKVPEKSIGSHVASGAFNSINSLSLAATGAGLMDRSTVDVLGVAGAASVLARRLHTDLTPEEMEQVADGMEDFHQHHYMDLSKKSLDEAKALTDQVESMTLPTAENGGDMAALQEINARRRDALNESTRILGTAAGEMEANAALVQALRDKPADKLEIPMGKAQPEAIIRQARALGLQRGDYSIDPVGGQTFLTITASGMDRLAEPVDRESMQQIRRNLDIIEGKQDEDQWLPKGFANRPDLDLKPAPGVAAKLAIPFEVGANAEQSLADYIGGRAADGDMPADIVADLQSETFMQKAGDRRAEYMQALNKLAPAQDADGKQIRNESLQASFEKMAEDFVQDHYGAELTPLHKQQFDMNQTSVDALHRALAAEPSGVAAYKPIGELDHKDQRALREYFAREVAKESPEAGEIRQKLDKLVANEPEQHVTDMFGEQANNPEWLAWKSERDDLSAQYNSSSLSWGKYVKAMGGTAKAYEAAQDLIRSKIAKDFHDNYNTLNPKGALKIGRTVIRNNLDHLDTVDPKARATREAKEAALRDGLRERVGGKYASGSVIDKLDQQREQQAAFEQSQLGMFSSEEMPAAEEVKALGADERYTLGHAAEQKIASMMSVVGKNFKPGQALKLWQPTMSGSGAPRQRAIKLLDANKRVGLAFGVGTGKTAIGLGGFSHLHEQGKIKKGLFVVPSIVQGQFGGEALRYLEPGKFKWHAEPGASFESRLQAYKDPENSFTVVTHQSFRDDMVKLGAQHAGIPEDQMSQKLGEMSRADRKAWIRGVMDREGIDHQYIMVDEGHNTLNRKGKEDSGMANVIDAATDNSEYFVSATADPVKNDLSELHDAMTKLAGGNYMDRDAFMRKYGVDTAASKDALRREMARYFYPSKIDPETGANRQEVKVQLNDQQKTELEKIDRHALALRLARMGGRVDVESAMALAPEQFKGVPEAQHEAVAKALQKNIGLLKRPAVRRVINNHPDGAKFEAAVNYARERKGKPGVFFTRSLEGVAILKARLEKEGFRVATITGADSSKDKEAKRQMFNPEGGAEAQADILVASDAAATGMNIQRGQWLTAIDTPETAMTHAQRQGRIYRTGQKNDVELADLVADHPMERADRARLQTKYALRDLVTSPLEGLDDSGLAYFLKQRRDRQQEQSGSLF